MTSWLFWRRSRNHLSGPHTMQMSACCHRNYMQCSHPICVEDVPIWWGQKLLQRMASSCGIHWIRSSCRVHVNGAWPWLRRLDFSHASAKIVLLLESILNYEQLVLEYEQASGSTYPKELMAATLIKCCQPTSTWTDPTFYQWCNNICRHQGEDHLGGTLIGRQKCLVFWVPKLGPV